MWKENLLRMGKKQTPEVSIKLQVKNKKTQKMLLEVAMGNNDPQPFSFIFMFKLLCY